MGQGEKVGERVSECVYFCFSGGSDGGGVVKGKRG